MYSRKQTLNTGTQSKPKKTFKRVQRVESDSDSDNNESPLQNPKRIKTSKVENTRSQIPKMISGSKSSPTGAFSKFERPSRRNRNIQNDVAINYAEDNDFFNEILSPLQSPEKLMNSPNNLKDCLDLTPTSSPDNIGSNGSVYRGM